MRERDIEELRAAGDALAELAADFYRGILVCMGKTPQGRWIPEGTSRSYKYGCSECAGIAYFPPHGSRKDPRRCLYKYCPHCGVRIQETKIEESEE